MGASLAVACPQAGAVSDLGCTVLARGEHRRMRVAIYLPIQQFTNKWLRKSVYNDKYTFNTFETIVDNDKSDATHIDMRNMQN